MQGVKNMKKQYVKPELYFENFELSTYIATCSPNFRVNHTISNCSRDIAGENTFMSNPTCKTTPQDEETICYHNPTEESRYFSS